MNCGCGKNEEQPKPTDITLSDLTAAAEGHDMQVEKAADNSHDGARALKKSGQISSRGPQRPYAHEARDRDRAVRGKHARTAHGREVRHFALQ